MSQRAVIKISANVCKEMLMLNVPVFQKSINTFSFYSNIFCPFLFYIHFASSNKTRYKRILYNLDNIINRHRKNKNENSVRSTLGTKVVQSGDRK